MWDAFDFSVSTTTQTNWKRKSHSASQELYSTSFARRVGEFDWSWANQPKWRLNFCLQEGHITLVQKKLPYKAMPFWNLHKKIHLPRTNVQWDLTLQSWVILRGWEPLKYCAMDQYKVLCKCNIDFFALLYRLYLCFLTILVAPEMEKAYKIANAKLQVWKISTQNMRKNAQNRAKFAKMPKIAQKKPKTFNKMRENIKN